MTLSDAKREAVRLANETGKIWSVVAKEGAECGLLGNNKECEVVAFPSGPPRMNMGNYGPGARL